jgi:hypothetical protein
MLKNNARHPNPKNNPYLARLSADFKVVCGKQDNIVVAGFFDDLRQVSLINLFENVAMPLLIFLHT